MQDSGVDNAASLSAHEMMERVTQQMGMLAFGASLPNYMGPDSLQQQATAGSGHGMLQQGAGPTSHGGTLAPNRSIPMAGGGGASGCAPDKHFGLGMMEGGGGGGMHAAMQGRSRRPRGPQAANKDMSHLAPHGEDADVDGGGVEGGYKALGRGAAGGVRGRGRKR